jgi:4-amino-4-deoxy-L-arabinose transferase-like glycosyltransferase
MNLRERCLAASIVLGLIIFLGTEMLSVFRLLVPSAIMAFWSLVFLVLLFIIVRQKEVLFRKVRLGPFDLSGYDVFIMGSLVLMAAALLVQGYFSAPNTADSMTYHLTRVMHWAQDHHIGFYAAHKERQLWMPPWAEYAVLHLYFLAGSDRLAFLVQWSAFGGCVIAASLIACHLGGGRLVQLSAAALCAAIPVVILESTSTQTDLIATFWLMNAVFWLLAWQKNGQRPVDACLSAVALGLAILTKTSMLLFAAPFVMGMIVLGGLARRLRSTFFALCLMVLVPALLSGPHLLRVWQGFGTLNPVTSEVRLTNETLTFPVFASNALKSVALNLTTPSQRLNNVIKGVVNRAHVLIGVDEDDPRINLAPGSEYLKKEHVFYESRPPNTLHMLLGVTVVGMLLFSFRTYGTVAVLYACPWWRAPFCWSFI